MKVVDRFRAWVIAKRIRGRFGTCVTQQLLKHAEWADTAYNDNDEVAARIFLKTFTDCGKHFEDSEDGIVPTP